MQNLLSLVVCFRCTMYAFYNTWKAQQADVGNHSFPEKFPYSCFRWSWYSYLHLLDIDTKQTFYCDEPGCGMHPSTLLFDGYYSILPAKFYASFSVCLSVTKNFLSHISQQLLIADA